MLDKRTKGLLKVFRELNSDAKDDVISYANIKRQAQAYRAEGSEPSGPWHVAQMAIISIAGICIYSFSSLNNLF